ncbi:MAG TPA: DUF2500 domain-containing protein [Bacillota bacterium]|nr:DUF2500 domain-containing protein [Bacillota bacterium]
MWYFFEYMFPVLFTLTFAILLAILAVTVTTVISRYIRDSKAPKVSAPATVVAKRTQFHGSSGHSGWSTYYATFEFETGDRLELYLPGSEAGLLVEGDKGVLTFQGKRFIKFERFM